MDLKAQAVWTVAVHVDLADIGFHGTVVSHVLGKFSKEERPKFDQAVEQAEHALEDWINGEDFAKLMNAYN